MTLTNNNENKNIFVYGKGATVGIDSGKIVTVDGVGTPTTPGNKTVGIYLENAGTGSIFNGARKAYCSKRSCRYLFKRE